MWRSDLAHRVRVCDGVSCAADGWVLLCLTWGTCQVIGFGERGTAEVYERPTNAGSVAVGSSTLGQQLGCLWCGGVMLMLLSVQEGMVGLLESKAGQP
jgi:hypothetical protein